MHLSARCMRCIGIHQNNLFVSVRHLILFIDLLILKLTCMQLIIQFDVTVLKNKMIIIDSHSISSRTILFRQNAAKIMNIVVGAGPVSFLIINISRD